MYHTCTCTEPNDLEGVIPASLFQVKNLTEVLLANNELSGMISTSVPTGGEYTYSIEKFDVVSNNFTGSIDFVSNLSNLKEVRLDSNMFSGKIPVSLGQLTNLRVLTLGDNSLTGSMPDEICKLAREHELTTLVADCGGSNPKVECACCTSCTSANSS